MSNETTELKGPDFGEGVDPGALADDAILLGHVAGEAVIVVRRGQELFALSASCTHYGGPLAKGLVIGDTIACPLHHARFSLRTGLPVYAPALEPICRWVVEQREGRLFVRGKAPPVPAASAARGASALSSIIIVGGGAAAQAAAETLRREGYTGNLTVLSAERASPTDRPNLSKDYLAGHAQEEWMPLRPPEFFVEHQIDLQLGVRVVALDVAQKTLRTDAGRTHSYSALLLATGADPIPLGIPGGELPHVHTLRTLEDSRAIIARAAKAKRALVIGASFIGLEVAAALRTRGLPVAVVAPESKPLERVFGPELGAFIRSLHEAHGVEFRLGHTAKSISLDSVVLDDGSRVAADLVVVGIGVRPALGLAEAAGLTLDRGILVNQYLETSAPGVFAAGDVARWPDPHTGSNIRVEHWVVAERQGQIAARNMLGLEEPCTLVPFFWSRHYDVGISYVGHAEAWDSIEIDGDLGRHDCRVRFLRGGRALAVATIGRHRESLRTEAEMERATAR